MNYIRNLSAILGVIRAINGILALIVDEGSAIGQFYERIWHHHILGKLAKPNVYDPFAMGSQFVIFHEDDLSYLSRDFSAIRDAVGGMIYTASKISSYNGHQPQGVIAFSSTLSDAEHKVRLMQKAVYDAKPKPNVAIPSDTTILIASGGIGIGRSESLEMFCRDYQTYQPTQLCFSQY